MLVDVRLKAHIEWFSSVRDRSLIACPRNVSEHTRDSGLLVVVLLQSGDEVCLVTRNWELAVLQKLLELWNLGRGVINHDVEFIWVALVYGRGLMCLGIVYNGSG